jgi:hypothetical protein
MAAEVLMVKEIGLLIVIMIVVLSYKLFFSRPQSVGAGVAGEASRPNGPKGPARVGQPSDAKSPEQIFHEVGAKNDLRNTSRAETSYRIQHNYIRVLR